uniref:Uncharacterized protein n=1 Tax=Solanum lycopersicum TaxID=4081 RepID=A0A3Q7HCD2_SOLLC
MKQRRSMYMQRIKIHGINKTLGSVHYKRASHREGIGVCLKAGRGKGSGHEACLKAGRGWGAFEHGACFKEEGRGCLKARSLPQGGDGEGEA